MSNVKFTFHLFFLVTTPLLFLLLKPTKTFMYVRQQPIARHVTPWCPAGMSPWFRLKFLALLQVDLDIAVDRGPPRDETRKRKHSCPVLNAHREDAGEC